MEYKKTTLTLTPAKKVDGTFDEIVAMTEHKGTIYLCTKNRMYKMVEEEMRPVYFIEEDGGV